MAEDVYVYALVRSCEPCQRKRAQRMNREHLLPVASGAVFDKVYVDLTGPIHTSDSGNKYIIAMIDHFTKYVVAAPLPDCSTITVAQAVMTECILKYLEYTRQPIVRISAPMETSDGAPPGLPPPGVSQSPHNNSTGEFSTDISLSRDPAETHNSLALEPTTSPLSAEHMGDDDATDVPVMRTRTSSGTDYDEVDMDTSSPPLSPPSRDPADTLTCLSSGRLDLSEEALLASPKGRKDELELSASLENLAVTMPPTATVLPGSDRFGLRCRQREEAVNREDSPSPTSGSGAPPPKRAAAELDATEFPPLSGFSSPPPGPSQPWPAASAPDEGGPPDYRRDTSPQRGGSGRFQRGGRNSGRGRGRGGGRGRGSNRRDRPAPRNQHWGTRATDAETDDKPARIPSQTPESFYHYLMRSHPWGEYVNPRPVRRLRDDTVLIGDEASQIPEPALAAISNCMPFAQQVYIGDVHQLQPHARCHRDSPAAIYGARGVMSVICAARAVPVAPLVRTYRAHPALNELPNRIAYNGALISGTLPQDRQMLTDIMRFPTPSVPFMFVNVEGTSTRAHNMSYFNDAELEACSELIHLLIAAAVSAANICVIAFYKEQYRRAERKFSELGIELSTVDAVQGREMEVVIFLTTKTHFPLDSAEPGGCKAMDDSRLQCSMFGIVGY
ncbi:hypothetical protein ANCCEY_13349 [Ancylostoma ceylanicum]|uniref:DNA2/NAM7 helicase-like C-terminal domain-containing protein n=1 Tax=Ancylostoma ceylanicum TaxID=53326 RepID=A0A0D6LIW1_9BILA|nr:hypothetical protein ANCCEY_13349 [Ancylostoma ceylanicum]